MGQVHSIASTEQANSAAVWIEAAKRLEKASHELKAAKIEEESTRQEMFKAVYGMRLTYRQQQVWDGIRGGKGYKEIATDLNISLRTVKFHASVLREKFNCQCGEQLRSMEFL